MGNNTDLDMEQMQEIIGDFLIEADELAETLDSRFVDLEASPDNPDLLNEIFRAVHTIKGTSSFLGLEAVTGLTHKMEDVLNRLRKHSLSLTPIIMDTLLEGLDLLKVTLDSIRDESLSPPDQDNILKRLDAIYQSERSEPDPVEPNDAAVAETVQSESDVEEARQSKEETAGRSKSADHTIRVDVDRLDHLINLIGELVLGRNSLVQSVSQASVEMPNQHRLEAVGQASTTVSFLTTEIQMAVMKMRMLPIGRVFARFPRQVRDLSREVGKQIDLHISGQETELDKTVIEEISDPLMHVIRNACDHGIESPEMRLKHGKSEVGNIWLDARQEGSNIVVTVRDDGRGINHEAVRLKAIERGMIDPIESEKLTERQVFDFVFQAGFSTARAVTGISGRGVGMDVVRTNIEKLNGIIELQSEPFVGTTMTIKLPLTLAIIRGLLVETDGEVYVLPLASVIETIRMEASAVHQMNRRPVLRLRDEVIPIVNLASVYGKVSSNNVLTEKPYVVVVGLADKKMGIMIDRFQGQEEVVIKSMGDLIGNDSGITGATIMGDGRVRLIVDLVGLFNLVKKQTSHVPA
ncbi:MAG TPA: chemotaxis protein CheA [candidate division Zixibacteria bacterium]|nr:chemotaxis protein CheA [candidate division Zixibacteria bacterium]